MVLGTVDALVAKRGTTNVRQVHFRSSAVNLNLKMDAQVAEYIITLFSLRGVAVSLLNGGLKWQLISETNQKSPSPLFRSMIVPTYFEVIIFLHSLSVASSFVRCENHTVVQCTLPGL